MKRTLTVLAACTALVVAAPATASAAKSPSPVKALTTLAAPQADFGGLPLTWKKVACSLTMQGHSFSWNFSLPSLAVPAFNTALAQIQRHFPALTCTIT